MLRHHGYLLCRQLARCLHTTHAQWQVNYYDALGIGKRSTQNEIKAAYYKLSMIYHPDRNKGSDSAAQKFREISQAYEVLGNYRLRRLYDKGIVHTAGSQYAQDIPEVDPDLDVKEDDAQTKFYKSRFKKSKVADTEGRTPIYDFDEWSRAHYGKSFDRRKAAQAKHERLRMQKEQSTISAQNDAVMFAFIFAGLLVYLMFVADSSYDTPRPRTLERSKEVQDQEADAATTATDAGKV